VSFEIIAPDTPGTGFEIIAAVAEAGGPEGAILSFPIPSVPIGTLLLALVIRDDGVFAPDGWTLIVGAIGSGTRFLDVYAHEIDASDANLADDDEREAAFSSLVDQELHGYLLALDNTARNVVVEAYASGTFGASATPSAPAVQCQQAINTLVRIWAADGEIDFTPPAGHTALDEYTSSEFLEQTFHAARMTANATGLLSTVEAAADPPADGHAWTLVLRNYPPPTPAELFDTVPGHVGLI
jgi:hypothetical protein